MGIPREYAIAIIAMLVACFAATTLDTATRLQRYVIQEMAEVVRIPALGNKYVATAIAVGSALSLALMRGPSAPGSPPAPYGTGGQYLWPLFGATNQLLAGLAFMVTVFYLARRNKPIWFVVLPMVVMILMPLWALLWNMFNAETGWWPQEKYLLFSIGSATILLQVWMVVEALLAWPKAKGVLEEALPPLAGRTATS